MLHRQSDPKASKCPNAVSLCKQLPACGAVSLNSYKTWGTLKSSAFVQPDPDVPRAVALMEQTWGTILSAKVIESMSKKPLDMSKCTKSTLTGIGKNVQHWFEEKRGDKILFIGDSVTAQWPWSLLCALNTVMPLKNKVINQESYYVDDCLAAGGNCKKVFESGLLSLPIIGSWFLEPFNITISFMLYYMLDPHQVNRVTSGRQKGERVANAALLRGVLEQHSTVIASLGKSISTFSQVRT
jgi:hypothetical protein